VTLPARALLGSPETDGRSRSRAGRSDAPLLAGLDAVAVVLGALVMELAGRYVTFEDSPSRKTLAFGVVLLVVFWHAGLYRRRLSLGVLADMPMLAGRWLVAVAIAVLGQVAWSGALWDDYVINWQFMFGAVLIGLLAVALKSVGYSRLRRARRRRKVEHRTLIVGAGAVGRQIGDILTDHREYGLHPVGFLDDDPHIGDGVLDLPLLGGPADLSVILSAGRVHNVVVAFSSMKESQMVRLIRTCDRYRCELFVVPRLFELHQTDGAMDSAWGFPLVRLRRATYRSSSWRVKRAFDATLAGLAILFLAPLLAVLALGVRLDGGPGIIFRQRRVGVDGVFFDVFKFRSLKPVDDTESATNWNIALDDRLTPFGRFLRKSSLDELPQLFNILRGDMSLVGPRPERPHFVDQFRVTHPSYEARHRVPSGLTGWAQVHGLRGDTSIVDRARFDNYYIENWSLWLDITIILRTVGAVLKGAGG
jgi:exopolysaccharide biosynthesis polyprenyl glycosylphosphotransferase